MEREREGEAGRLQAGHRRGPGHFGWRRAKRNGPGSLCTLGGRDSQSGSRAAAGRGMVEAGRVEVAVGVEDDEVR